MQQTGTEKGRKAKAEEITCSLLSNWVTEKSGMQTVDKFHVSKKTAFSPFTLDCIFLTCMWLVSSTSSVPYSTHCEINHKHRNPDGAMHRTAADSTEPLPHSRKVCGCARIGRAGAAGERNTYVHAYYVTRECSAAHTNGGTGTDPLVGVWLLMRYGASARARRGAGASGPGRPPGGSRRRPREPPAGRAAAPAVPPAVGVETGWQPPPPLPAPAPRSPCPASRQDRWAPPCLPRRATGQVFPF